MTLRRMMLASCAVAVAAACSTFSSTDTTTPPSDAGADGAPPPTDASPPNDAGVTEDAAPDASFHCSAPAESCAFQRQVCCLSSDGGVLYGECRPAGATCELGDFLLACDSPGPCRALYGTDAAACCSANGVTACRQNGCGVDEEMCRPGVMPAECGDASAGCFVQSGGYGHCE